MYIYCSLLCGKIERPTPRFRGQEERETSPPVGGAENQPAAAAACRLNVERQIPGDDSGGAGLPALLTVDSEFIREQTPGRTQFFCVWRPYDFKGTGSRDEIF